jgi:hypothetical protein
MNIVSQFPEERPTRPAKQYPAVVLVLADEIDKHARLALDALRSGSPDAVRVASHCLVEIEALAAEVAR